MNDTTIAAISTPQGIGGVAIIRISGKEAFEITQQFFVPNRKDKKLSQYDGYTAHYGTINDTEGREIDDVIVTLFKAPHSFTGENTVEISCHGSSYIQQQILQLSIENGCKLAKAGEFTMRAFLNGKMDLSQAEAVADLISSQSASTHKMAMHQMRGGFSEKLSELRNGLLHFVSMIELELDFSEEDVNFANRDELIKLAKNIQKTIAKLAHSFSTGNALKKGIPVALVGETNVGKSTLLNYLLNEEKAIVSDIHGTTRDTIEDIIDIEGITFRFIDTAGIRKTTDVVENLGIERTYKKIEQSKIVLWVIDSTQITEHIEWLTEKIAKRAMGKKIILVFNKIDKLQEEEKEIVAELFNRFEAERLYISAKEQMNTENLKKAIVSASTIKHIDLDDVIVSNARHYEALINAQAAIKKVLTGLDEKVSEEFLSRDIRECMDYLGEITGEFTTDEVLGNIFKNFCIGK